MNFPETRPRARHNTESQLEVLPATEPGVLPPLVSSEWLAAHLGNPRLVVLDASFFLPNEKRDARAEFAQVHLPGAGFFSIEAIADPDTDLPHMVPSMGRFGRMMAIIGVSETSQVVFYDSKGLFSAARGWWMMQLFGLGTAAVLDGGLPKWLEEGRTVENGQPVVQPPRHLRLTLHAELLRGAGDMFDNLCTGHTLVLDARSTGRFTGRIPESRPGTASGHIPGARSLPYTDLLAPDGTMLPPATLRARFAALGADGSRPIVTTCGTGITAAVINLALVVAGLTAAALYDGSWAEWGTRPDTPKALGTDEYDTPAATMPTVELADGRLGEAEMEQPIG